MKHLIRKNKAPQQPRESIGDVVLSTRQRRLEEAKAQLGAATVEIDTQMAVFETGFMRSRQRARNAAESSSQTEKSIAMGELKFNYCMYHYMRSLRDAFRILQSRVTMQEMTEQFASVVNALSHIKVPESCTDFEALTAKALGSLNLGDLNGLEDMVHNLIAGTLGAANAYRNDDSFLEDLVSGRATLDMPYIIASESAAPAASSAAAPTPGNEDDLRAMLKDLDARLAAG